MSSIQYLRGDATQPVGSGPKIIAHICNDVGGWGRGFVVALSQRWSQPEAAYRDWYRGRDDGNDFELGAVQIVAVEEDLFVANIIGQHGIRPTADGPPVRYWAIEAGLSDLADEALGLGASVHMPRIGCGLAGGEWESIESIITRTLLASDIETTVYDL
jgi:O-acetyl-ADP-ribose deacetylase (regulator of RNase III)